MFWIWLPVICLVGVGYGRDYFLFNMDLIKTGYRLGRRAMVAIGIGSDWLGLELDS